MTNQTTPPKIDWRPEFDTGIPGIDHEHKEMIDRINTFLASAEAGQETDVILDQLGEILAWISAHFALEEKMMRDQRYDQYIIHKEDHENLIDELRDIMDEVEANGYSGIGQNIQARMTSWFVGHFKNQDARLHRKLGH